MRAVEWRSLSPRGRAILRQIELPLELGVDPATVASRLNLSRIAVRRLRKDLRDELDALRAEDEAAPAEQTEEAGREEGPAA